MSSVDLVLEGLRELRSRHPEVASAALIALAVERHVLPEGKAKAWAQTLDLADFERVKALLVREVDQQGHRSVLVDLLRSSRRVQRRTELLLRASERS
jgi:hypothetical protein